MFQLIGTNTYDVINNSIAYYKGLYSVLYNNETSEIIPLTIEKCELGKNIDSSYSNIISKETLFGKSIEEFYCINFNSN